MEDDLNKLKFVWRVGLAVLEVVELLTLAEFAWYRRWSGGDWVYLYQNPMTTGIWMRNGAKLPKAQVR